MRTILIFLVALFALSASATERLSLDEVCALVKCRPDTDIAAVIDAERYYEGVWPRSPYFFDGIGSVAIGETVSFEVTKKPDGVLEFTYVPQPTSTSITFELGQWSAEDRNPMTVAKIENKSPYFIIYEGGVFHVESQSFGRTSVCSLAPDFVMYESWPYAVGMFTFTRPRAVSEEEAVEHGCQ